jgi:hypothetical protein
MREFDSRRSGSPVDTLVGLRGKLRYIGKNGLADDLVVKHMGLGGGRDISEAATDPEGNLVIVTSMGLGDPVTFAGLFQEICDGEDVELGFLYKGGGGHRVELVGAGTILGVPWVAHTSDYVQSHTDNDDGIDNDEGTDRVDFSFFIDTDGDNMPNIIYNKANANVHSFFSQSPNR